MSDYVFLPKIAADISAECDVTRVLSNRRHRTASTLDFQMALYRQRRGSCEWELLDRAAFGDKLVLHFDSDRYDLETGELAVGVPMASGEAVPDRCTALPEPISRRRDDALVAERAAIRFVHRGARSSYQGDYPYEMSRRPKGSLLSMGSLIGCQPDDVRTIATMVNICSLPLESKRPCYFRLYDAATRELVAESAFEANSVAVLDVPQAYNSGAQECYFRCEELLGIPIYVTMPTAEGTSGLSVEHTHPPTEYFWPTAASAGAPLVKAAWKGGSQNAA